MLVLGLGVFRDPGVGIAHGVLNLCALRLALACSFPVGQHHALLVWSRNRGWASRLDSPQPIGALAVTGATKQPARASIHLVSSLCCWLLLAACPSAAQGPPAERTFHTSRADVQKALHEIPSYSSGKLPVL